MVSQGTSEHATYGSFGSKSEDVSLSHGNTAAGETTRGDRSSNVGQTTKCGCGRLKDSCCFNCQRIDAVNLELNHRDPGIWDDWGVYYCSSRFGRHTKFNGTYFAIVAIIVFAQSNFFHLIHLIHTNGGVTFLLAVFLVYILIGYPTYLMETFLGQYSGQKPIHMIRLLLPVFSGLGVSMYIRTFFRAIVLISRCGICLFYMWDLMFCNTASCTLLKRSIEQERDHRDFKLLHGLSYPLFTSNPNDEAFDELKWILFFLGFSLFVTFMKLSQVGNWLEIAARLLVPMMTFFSFNILYRMWDVWFFYGVVKEDTLILRPLHHVFKPNWILFLDIDVWVKAIVYVMNSLDLGTLVHSYLGSKLFFHYRCSRDGVLLVLLTVIWNVLGAIGVLLWLGYITISEQEVANSLDSIDGHYGMFIVYILKHIQAELTTKVESDTLFYCSFLYLIIFTASILASMVYIYILVDCAAPEGGHSLTKLCTHVGILLLVALIFFPMTFARDGLRHLTFLNFYGADQGVCGLFNILAFSVAVFCSQGIARLLYDFYNVVHLKGFEIRTRHYCAPRIIVVVYLVVALSAFLREAVKGSHRLAEGATNWNGFGTIIVGNIISFFNFASWLFGVVFYFIKEKRKGTAIFKPHRDFYKNRFHTSVCFKDFKDFCNDQKWR